MFKHLFKILIFISLVSSCAPNLIKIMPEYLDRDIPNENLAIIIQSSPDISNEDDVLDDIGDSHDAYINLFKEQFPIGIKKNSKIKTCDFPKTKNRIKYESIIFNINEEKKIRLNIPVKDSNIEFNDFDANFILFLSKIDVSRIFISNVGNPGGSEHLKHIAEFFIWDKENSKIVSYGIAEDTEILFFAMTLDTWKGGIKGLAITILNESPFKIPRRKYP